jgi:predicted HicB family RNase H-like nuclease
MKGFMHYKDYYGSVNFDENELVFYGKLEFIRALVDYEATDATGLKKAFEEAVDDYIELCRTQNIAPETPFKGSLKFRLGPELHREVAAAASANRLTINKFITQTLGRAIKADNI